MYRIDRTSFERLVDDLSNHPAFDLRAHNALPVYVQVSCAIWRLANCHLGYRTYHMAWGVSHGSYMNFFRRFLTAIKDVYGNLISWPLENDRVDAIQNGFEYPHGNRPGAIRRLPNVIGALDGRFTYIRVGDSGRTHDAAAYFLSNGYILADSAYPLCPNIIVPYPTSEVRGESAEATSKRKFNKVHSSARMTIEKAFWRLAARWRFITCILHNFCININDPDFPPDEVGDDDDDDDVFDESGNSNENNRDGNNVGSLAAGRSRRQQLNRWFSQ
ncbi:hypothetical protein INT47_007553 [Mucor saturninus]|uniref:DDE Tnp4 domain-containing protein n=1 Tax=Mucor saturninus TaxID=64648 RepID=A0A8H7QG89_9FUNG|nr:hypothetical protein INT47_007553 [Mucor saturninus]